MNIQLPAWLISIWNWIVWGWTQGITVVSAAWKTSKTATEIMIVATVAFVVLVYFGFFDRPDLTPNVTKEMATLSAKIDALTSSVATKADVKAMEGMMAGMVPPAKITTGSIVHKSKPKDAE